MPRWWNGRHASLRCWWQKCRGGSSPLLGTIRYAKIIRNNPMKIGSVKKRWQVAVIVFAAFFGSCLGANAQSTNSTGRTPPRSSTPRPSFPLTQASQCQASRLGPSLASPITSSTCTTSRSIHRARFVQATTTTQTETPPIRVRPFMRNLIPRTSGLSSRTASASL